MEKIIEKLHSYLIFPEVTKLLNNCKGSCGTNPDRHSQHVQEGYKILNAYTYGQDVSSLDEAVRYFNRILKDDKKYLQALAWYGKAVAHGMADKFKDAQEAIGQLKALKTSIGTDYPEEIQDLKHYASEEMLVDLRRAFQRLHPNEKIPQHSGCVILILVFITSSLLVFL